MRGYNSTKAILFDVKVFWSWQSDTRGKTGRAFIHDVLLDAVAQLKETPELCEREEIQQLAVDKDRQGTPGSPELARLIFNKIEQSAVFVADVTITGSAPPLKDGAAPKALINSNVAIELGYALRALGDKSLLMVMNDYYGSYADLPFDLRSRAGPIMFTLPPDASSDTIRVAARDLKRKLADAVQACLAAHIESVRQLQPFSERPATNAPSVYFDEREILALGPNTGEGYRFMGPRAVYLRLFPTFVSPAIGQAPLLKIFTGGAVMPMSMGITGLCSQNRYGPILYNPKQRPGGYTLGGGLTQGFASGELWGINGDVFIERHPNGINRNDKPRWTLPILDLEQLYVKTLKKYVGLAYSEMKLPLPYTIELGATGLTDVFFTTIQGNNSPVFHGKIQRPFLQVRGVLDVASDEEILTLLRSFFQDFYDIAFLSRSDLLSDDVVTANNLPPL